MRDWTDVVFGIIVTCLIFGMVVLACVAIDARIPKLTDGVIVDKEFVAAHKTTHTQMIWSGKVAIPRVITRHHSDTWRIQVTGTTKGGRERTEWWNVNETFYNSVEVGDWVKKEEATTDDQ